MKKLITAALMMLVFITAIAFSGCEETQQTLEDMASSDADLVNIITDQMETPDGTSGEVSFSGDSFDVTYTFDDELEKEDCEKLVKAFDSNASQLKDNCEGAISDLSKQTNISGITGTLHINNADGGEIWVKSYPEKGSEE